MSHTDLTTLADVKAWMNIAPANTADDAVLTRLITAASSAIFSYLNRDLLEDDYVEVRNGKGGTSMMMNNLPIIRVTKLLIDGLSIPKSTGPFSAGWIASPSALYLRGFYTFNRGVQNIQVSYSAGYEEIPAEVAQACIELVSLRHKERDRIGLVSKGLAGETISFTQKDFTNSIRQALDQFRRVAPVMP